MLDLHVAGVCQQFLQDEGIDAMDWPARSPDLNPIEHIWDIMSRSIHQRHVAPQTVQELADALVQVWEEIPQETILPPHQEHAQAFNHTLHHSIQQQMVCFSCLFSGYKLDHVITLHFHCFALRTPVSPEISPLCREQPVFHLLLLKPTPGSSLWRINEVLHALTQPDDRRLAWWTLKEKPVSTGEKDQTDMLVMMADVPEVTPPQWGQKYSIQNKPRYPSLTEMGILSRETTRDPPVKSEFTVTLNHKVSLEFLLLNSVVVALLQPGLKGDLVIQPQSTVIHFRGGNNSQCTTEHPSLEERAHFVLKIFLRDEGKFELMNMQCTVYGSLLRTSKLRMRVSELENTIVLAKSPKGLISKIYASLLYSDSSGYDSLKLLWERDLERGSEHAWVPRLCCAGLERSNASLQGVCQIEVDEEHISKSRRGEEKKEEEEEETVGIEEGRERGGATLPPCEKILMMVERGRELLAGLIFSCTHLAGTDVPFELNPGKDQ
ncbi:hypothetical protein L3Q82_006407 [Scortum barcoo]|uniref:Uncharacterized protein n=1 Tax=Scortum barcoo TaxID=214431 RepID=A0ACB8WZY6_9TELE|nr:hypothetical protein L3Q82_006407 [Scortum barcoo]